jgi:hypothetical protein
VTGRARHCEVLVGSDIDQSDAWTFEGSTSDFSGNDSEADSN